VDTNAVWALLMRYPPDAGARSAAPRPKADPLTHGVEEGAKTIDMLP
jgi:hypothetical protein